VKEGNGVEWWCCGCFEYDVLPQLESTRIEESKFYFVEMLCYVMLLCYAVTLCCYVMPCYVVMLYYVMLLCSNKYSHLLVQPDFYCRNAFS